MEPYFITKNLFWGNKSQYPLSMDFSIWKYWKECFEHSKLEDKRELFNPIHLDFDCTLKKSIPGRFWGIKIVINEK